MAQKFYYGWKKQPFDPRDVYFHPPRNPQGADYADLSPDKGPYMNQADEGSCGPNSYCEMVLYDQKVQGLVVLPIARNHLYWWTRYLMGTTGSDSGVDNRTLMKAAATYGVCDERLWPYNTHNFTTKPSDAANQAALQNRITDYAAVVQSASQIQGTLLTLKRPILTGFSVYKQLESDEAAATGIIRMPGPGETPIGGHDMNNYGFTLVDRPGVKPGNKWPAGTYKLGQHWINYDGSPWGDGGFGYMPFAYAHDLNLAGDYWIAGSIPSGGIPTPPGPTPAPNDRFHFTHQVGVGSWPMAIRGVPVGTMTRTTIAQPGKTYPMGAALALQEDHNTGESRAITTGELLVWARWVLRTWGPLAVPIIERLIATLPWLTEAEKADFDRLLEDVIASVPPG